MSLRVIQFWFTSTGLSSTPSQSSPGKLTRMSTSPMSHIFTAINDRRVTA